MRNNTYDSMSPEVVREQRDLQGIRIRIGCKCVMKSTKLHCVRDHRFTWIPCAQPNAYGTSFFTGLQSAYKNARKLESLDNYQPSQQEVATEHDPPVENDAKEDVNVLAFLRF
jgi:hypothetical protein